VFNLRYVLRPRKQLSIIVYRELRDEAKETAERQSVLRAETEERSIEHVMQYNTTGWQYSVEKGTRKFL
jgi:hypothetical protein